MRCGTELVSFHFVRVGPALVPNARMTARRSSPRAETREAVGPAPVGLRIDADAGK